MDKKILKHLLLFKKILLYTLYLLTKVYHAFVLGMLIGLSDQYEIKSNRESGHGRYDVLLIPKNPHDLGIVMFKKTPPLKPLNLL